MTATLSTPPSARDFDVYEHIAIGGNTTRQAAQRFKISQTRICQVIRKVVAFTAEVLPPILEAEIPEARRLALSKNVAALRLEHLYNESLAAWKDSRGESWRLREPLFPPGGFIVRTTWKDFGKVVYLNQALKISKQAMELAIPLPMGLLGEEDEEETSAAASGADHSAVAAPKRDADEFPADPAPPFEATGSGVTDAQVRELASIAESMRRTVDRLPPVPHPPVGGCSENGPIPQPAAVESPELPAQVPAAQEDPQEAVAAPAAAQIAVSALFNPPATPAFNPLDSRPNAHRRSRAARRARQRQAQQHLARRRALAAVG